jgi:predicted SprT family Zn-dependent metalloprotease
MNQNQENLKTQKKVNTDNTYSDIYESCSICGKNMYKVSQIWVDRATDRYACRHCVDKYEIESVRCRDLEY